MSDTGNRFRTVAFGGFHKQDVLDYITSMNREYQDQIADLTQRAEKAQRERDELAQRAVTAEAAQKKSAEECDWLSAELTERATALDRAERELAGQTEELEKARVRLEELEEQAPRLEEDAAAYAALKDRTATIELEAHRKAQETVEQAEAQAAKTRSELEIWLRRVQNGYQHLHTGVAATLTHLTEELERGKQVLEEAAPALQEHDEALTALLDCERTAAGPKAPEPLPLEEGEEDV